MLKYFSEKVKKKFLLQFCMSKYPQIRQINFNSQVYQVPTIVLTIEKKFCNFFRKKNHVIAIQLWLQYTKVFKIDDGSGKTTAHSALKSEKSAIQASRTDCKSTFLPSKQGKKQSICITKISKVIMFLELASRHEFQLFGDLFLNISRLLISCLASSTNQKPQNIQKKPAK